MHKNVFGGRAPPRRGRGRKGLEIVGSGRRERREGREGGGKEKNGKGGMRRGGSVRGREGVEGGERVAKGDGGVDLYICPGALAEFLVTLMNTTLKLIVTERIRALYPLHMRSQDFVWGCTFS